MAEDIKYCHRGDKHEKAAKEKPHELEGCLWLRFCSACIVRAVWRKSRRRADPFRCRGDSGTHRRSDADTVALSDPDTRANSKAYAKTHPNTRAD